MKIIVYDKKTGEVLQIVQQEIFYDVHDRYGPRAFAIDLQKMVPFDQLVFSFSYDSSDNGYLVRADGYVLHAPPPFWDAVTGRHIVAIDRLVTETMALTYVPAQAETIYRAYSKTCPPLESSDNVRLTSSSGGDASSECSPIKVGEWVGAHGVSVTITEPSDGTSTPPTTQPGLSAPDDPPWFLRHWYMDCI